MKKSMIPLVVFLLIGAGSYAQNSRSEVSDHSILDFYRQYSAYTDPGEFAYLYESLPDSLPVLCSLIRSQFIHPYAELNAYRDQIPRERWNEMYSYPTVNSILGGLVSYDSSGLTSERKPEHRLIMGCQQSAILLASILKHRGIPARVRYGHATYLISDFHTSHVICEVWNEDENRWMLVDPSTDRVDFNPDKFDFSHEAFLQMLKGEIDPSKYGIPRRYSGIVSIVAKVNADMAAVLGTEYPVSKYSPMLEYAFENENQLSAEHINTLHTICELMNTLDGDHILKLQEIYASTPEIQMTKSFY